VLLEGELKAGEQVVVEGVQRLREGVAVRVLNAAPQAQPVQPVQPGAAGRGAP
jgi:multidrug efflux system membrane fusion protein